MKAFIIFALGLGFMCMNVDGAEPEAGASAVKITYAGGDGKSVENAVLIQVATDSHDAVPAEYDWLDKKYPGCELIKQRLIKEKDRFYDCMTIKTAKGQEIKIYFDITEPFKNNIKNSLEE